MQMNLFNYKTKTVETKTAKTKTVETKTAKTSDHGDKAKENKERKESLKRRAIYRKESNKRANKIIKECNIALVSVTEKYYADETVKEAIDSLVDDVAPKAVAKNGILNKIFKIDDLTKVIRNYRNYVSEDTYELFLEIENEY